MDLQVLKQRWLEEERIARIHGWDFSHISGRYCEEDSLQWDYLGEIGAYRRDEMRLLDIDTADGKIPLSLGHPCGNIYVTEGYAPNIALCKETLEPLGVHVFAADDAACLPFENDFFDMVINRHGDFDADELYRILKPGGMFITQQVGEDNDRELVELLLPGLEKPFPGHNLRAQCENFRRAGFEIISAQEAFGPIRFFDVGALVWFARIIQWEFPGFCVENCFDGLLQAQKQLEENGSISGRIHRFFIAARKAACSI